MIKYWWVKILDEDGERSTSGKKGVWQRNTHECSQGRGDFDFSTHTHTHIQVLSLTQRGGGKKSILSNRAFPNTFCIVGLIHKRSRLLQTLLQGGWPERNKQTKKHSKLADYLKTVVDSEGRRHKLASNSPKTFHIALSRDAECLSSKYRHPADQTETRTQTLLTARPLQCDTCREVLLVCWVCLFHSLQVLTSAASKLRHKHCCGAKGAGGGGTSNAQPFHWTYRKK